MAIHKLNEELRSSGRGVELSTTSNNYLKKEAGRYVNFTFRQHKKNQMFVHCVGDVYIKDGVYLKQAKRQSCIE